MVKKIFHIIFSLSGGGSEKQLYKLCEYQISLDYNVNICVFKWCDNCKKLEKKGIKIYLFDKFKYYQLKSLIKIISLQKKLNPDISISWSATLDFILFISSKINNQKFYINERSSIRCYQNFYIKDYKKSLLKTSITHNYFVFLYHKITRYFSLKYCNQIITNSLHMKNYYICKFPKKNVSQINNLIDLNDKIQNYSLNKSFTFLMVSRIIESKNMEIVIESLKNLTKSINNINLVIIGRGYHLNKIASLAGNQLNNNIKIISELDKWYFKFNKEKTYFINPSLYEGQPNVVLEAAFSQIPLILSDIPAHKDLFDDNSALFFNPYSLDSLIKNMNIAFYENHENRKLRTINAIEKKIYFSPEYVLSRYKKLI